MTTGFLIVSVTDAELDLLRAVRDGDDLGSRSDEEVVARAVERGLLDRVAGSAGGVALTVPARHTLWHHDRPPGLQDAPWERCEGCGSINVSAASAWGRDHPVRADCLACGVVWTEPA
jgi:hypothetical protein